MRTCEMHGFASRKGLGAKSPLARGVQNTHSDADFQPCFLLRSGFEKMSRTRLEAVTGLWSNRFLTVTLDNFKVPE